MDPPTIGVKAEPIVKAPDTQSLLKEFETVFDAVEFTHGALTPPQSPPYEQVLTQLEPIVQQQLHLHVQKTPIVYTPIDTLVRNQLVYPVKMMEGVAAAHTPIITRPIVEYLTVPSGPYDVERELAVVDELVRTRVEDMIQSSGPSSPSNSSTSSSSSNFGDISSDDPEWIPEPINHHESVEIEKPSRKRSKPYSRNTEEKKSRKKEQNKNAATRYRMKKKAEIAEILGEEQGLQDHNEDLQNKICDVQREIKYLKNLMRELFKAKGLIK